MFVISTHVRTRNSLASDSFATMAVAKALNRQLPLALSHAGFPAPAPPINNKKHVRVDGKYKLIFFYSFDENSQIAVKYAIRHNIVNKILTKLINKRLSKIIDFHVPDINIFVGWYTEW